MNLIKELISKVRSLFPVKNWIASFYSKISMNLIKELISKVRSLFPVKNWIASFYSKAWEAIKKKFDEDSDWTPEGSRDAFERFKKDGKLNFKLYFLIWYYQYYYRQLAFGYARSEVYSVISAIIFFIFIVPRIVEWFLS